MRARLAEDAKWLAKLTDGQVHYLSETSISWSKKIEHHEFSRFVSAPHVWDDAMRRAISNVERDIRSGSAEESRLHRRIADWQPRDLQEIDEQGRTRADRDAAAKRKQERADAKAARDAKKAALEAKRAAKRAEGQALLDAASTALKALDVAAPGARDQAIAILKGLSKGKNASAVEAAADTYYWEGRLGCADMLVALGLAEKPAHLPGAVWYTTSLWRKK